MRPVLSKLQISTLAIGLAVGGIVACGDDAEPAPQDGNYNPGGDGDNTNGGDGDNTNGGDGDTSGGDGDVSGQCETGASQACTCNDGVTQGSQICVFGSFGECTGCPCADGANQACQCAEGGLGSQTCSAGSFGECTCSAVDPEAACPAETMCAPLGGQASLPSMCIVPGGLNIPPECTTNDDCAAKGFVNPSCLDNPIAFPPFVPAKICLQTCQAATTTAP